jgi:DNA-directed RNA polymerase specialized sigma24 family protein
MRDTRGVLVAGLEKRMKPGIECAWMYSPPVSASPQGRAVQQTDLARLGMHAAVHRALAGLSAAERAAATLYYGLGRNASEVAHALHVPEAEVRRLLYRAQCVFGQKMAQIVSEVLSSSAADGGFVDRVLARIMA